MHHSATRLHGHPPEIEILLPNGERLGAESWQLTTVCARLPELEGKVIGIVSNGWHCMRVIAQEYSATLVKQYGARATHVYETPATMAISPHLSGRIAAECDAAIVGIGN